MLPKVEIGEPDKFQLASIVTKNSRTGLSSNRRLLVIKRGHLYYYSVIPKSFKGDPKILQSFHELPKCSIQIAKIKQVKGYEASSSYFSIDFEAKNMMEKEDIRKTLASEDFNFAPKNINEQITWQFTCDNQFIKQRWVSALTSLKDYYSNEETNIQKYFENIDQKEGKSSEDMGKGYRNTTVKTPWRESQVYRRSSQITDGIGKSPPKSLQDIRNNGSNSSLQRENSQKQLPKEEIKLIPISNPDQSQKELNLNNSLNKLNQSKQSEKPSNVENIESAFKITNVKIREGSEKRLATVNILPSLSPKSDELLIHTIVEEPIEDSSQKFTTPQQTPFKQNQIGYSDSQQPSKVSSQQHSKDVRILEKEESKISLKSQVVRMEKQESKTSDMFLKNIDSARHLREEELYEHQIPSYQTSRSKAVDLEKQVYLKQINIKSFYQLCKASCNLSIPFSLRFQIQMSLNEHINIFKKKSIQSFIQYVENLTTQNSKQKFTPIEKSNNLLTLQIGNIFYKIALVTTQTILINEKSKIYFNEESIKNLKREFKIYEDLFDSVINQIKLNCNFLLRVPLVMYMEYKGLACLAFQLKSEEELISFEKDSFQTHSNQNQEKYTDVKNWLQQQGYTLDHFIFKLSKINSQQELILYIKTKGRNLLVNSEESLKEHLKKLINISRPEKNHNIKFEPPIDQTFLEIARKQHASTSLESLENYIKGLRQVKQFHGVCPKEEIIQALTYCHFCKNLRKIYRSAQGEIDQTHFFNLIFREEPSIINLLKQSSCQEIPQIKGQLFSFLEHYMGVVLELDDKFIEEIMIADHPNHAGKKNTNKKDLCLSVKLKPIIRSFSLESLEIYESFAKLPQYINCNHHLARESFEIKKKVYRNCLHAEEYNSDGSSYLQDMDKNLQILLNEAELDFNENDYLQCIKKCKIYEQSCDKMSTKLLAVYLLLIKVYSSFSLNQFEHIIQKATALICYNYGHQHSSLVNLYCLCSFYFYKLANKSNHSTHQRSELIQKGITFLEKSLKMCLLIFGNQSKQYVDILLDFSRFYRNIDKNKCLNYLEEAKLIYLKNSHLKSAEAQEHMNLYQAETYLALGDLDESFIKITALMKLMEETHVSDKSFKQVSKLLYDFGLFSQKYQLCEIAVENIWKLSSETDKIEALDLAYKLALREKEIENENISDEQSYISDSIKVSKSKGLIYLEKEKKAYDSLVELISEALQVHNNKVIGVLQMILEKN